MIGQIAKKDLLQNRKHGIQTLENCFYASDVIYETTLWALTYFKTKLGKLSKEKLFCFFQLLLDLNAIENSIAKRPTFDEYSVYKFTEVVIGLYFSEGFVDKITNKFAQLQIVNKFIHKKENVVDFYQRAFHSTDKLDIRNMKYRLKVYKSVFIGSEMVDWLKKNYCNLELERYGYTVLGECFRQLKAFDHAVCEHSMKDGYFFYKIREETEFMYNIIQKYEMDDSNSLQC
jgi:hypothetical protein